MNKLRDIKIKKLDKSQIEIVAELEADNFKSYWPKALKEIGASVKIDGFRTGNIPENILVKNIGEINVLEKAAEMALGELYPEILFENKLRAIGRPEISITKIAKDNPLGFSIKVSILPEFILPDYKAMAKEISSKDKNKKIEVADSEVDNVIEQIRKSRAKTKEDGKTEPELPLLDDAFVKSIGNFENVDDLKNKIRENIREEKEMQKKEEIRMSIIEKIAEKTPIDVPQVLIDAEIDRIISETKGKVEQYGLKFEEYLKNVKKTEDDLKKESQEAAEKRVKYNLILKTIAREEKISPLKEETDVEMQKILDYYKGADPQSVRIYVEDILTNEKVFNFLESQE